MKTDLSVLTADGVRIALSHYRQGKDRLVVVSHGFYNSRRSLSLRRVTGFLLPMFDVITFDYRGHGQSGGKYTFGARERNDIAAVIRYAASFAYSKKALIGFSLGAAVPVVAMSDTRPLDSLILVSCPWDFYHIDCHFWESPALVALRDLFGENGRERSARIGNPFLSKPCPASIMSFIDSPTLLVHGQRDWLIKPWHSRALFKSLRGRGKLEILYDGFHGEKLMEQFPERFRQIALDWFKETLS